MSKEQSDKRRVEHRWSGPYHDKLEYLLDGRALTMEEVKGYLNQAVSAPSHVERIADMDSFVLALKSAYFHHDLEAFNALCKRLQDAPSTTPQKTGKLPFSLPAYVGNEYQGMHTVFAADHAVIAECYHKGVAELLVKFFNGASAASAIRRCTCYVLPHADDCALLVGITQSGERVFDSEKVLVSRSFLEATPCPNASCQDGMIINTGPDPVFEPCQWCEEKRLILSDLPRGAADCPHGIDPLTGDCDRCANNSSDGGNDRG